MSTILFQLPLAPALPLVQGNADYLQFRNQLLRIEELLVLSGLEDQLLQADLDTWLAAHPKSTPKSQQNHQLHARRALRCNLARILLNVEFRNLASRLADSPLLQYFCGLAEIDRVRVPAKSALQRYAHWWKEEQVRALVQQLTLQAAQQPEVLLLENPLDLDSYFLDTTCLPTYIHYPVDWILFRDATRTLMKACLLIRQQGLKHRMEEPEIFLSRMNRLCQEMAQVRTQPDSARRRKRIFRKIDRLVGTVRSHAKRHRQLLDQEWEQTDWTRPQAEQVLRRLDHILELLPQAREQARQRILEEQPVDSSKKLLSLYETETRVLVRHKAGAEVEFGNTLLVGENAQGIILDWKLFEGSAPGDARLLLPNLDAVQKAYGPAIKTVVTDRGFDSQKNQAGLAQRKLYNGLCPRSPKVLKKKGRSPKFRKLQRRRGQTEGRIAILKNKFLGERPRSKGFAHRALAVSWAVLTHNLWVLARQPRIETETPAAQAA